MSSIAVYPDYSCHQFILYLLLVAESHQVHKVPLEKSFVFHQPRAEYSVHPVTTGTSDAEHPDTVSEQPRSSKSDSGEVYQTSSDGASDGKLKDIVSVL